MWPWSAAAFTRPKCRGPDFFATSKRFHEEADGRAPPCVYFEEESAAIVGCRPRQARSVELVSRLALGSGFADAAKLHSDASRHGHKPARLKMGGRVPERSVVVVGPNRHRYPLVGEADPR